LKRTSSLLRGTQLSHRSGHPEIRRGSAATVKQGPALSARTVKSRLKEEKFSRVSLNQTAETFAQSEISTSKHSGGLRASVNTTGYTHAGAPPRLSIPKAGKKSDKPQQLKSAACDAS